MSLSERDLSTRWQHARPQDCVWSDCGDAYVVFHRPSGKTHLMNDASARLLRELLRSAETLEAVACEFEPGIGNHESAEYLERLVAMLRRLEQLGLIERQ